MSRIGSNFVNVTVYIVSSYDDTCDIISVDIRFATCQKLLKPCWFRKLFLLPIVGGGDTHVLSSLLLYPLPQLLLLVMHQITVPCICHILTKLSSSYSCWLYVVCHVCFWPGPQSVRDNMVRIVFQHTASRCLLS